MDDSAELTIAVASFATISFGIEATAGALAKLRRGGVR